MLFSFHLVEMSPWPLLGGGFAAFIIIGMLLWMKEKHIFLLFFSLFLCIWMSGLWWRDVIREASFQGHHTLGVMSGVKVGFALFIVSEVLFFFSFFWGFFEFSLSPPMDLGGVWPSESCNSLDIMGVPLLNTALLLTSGILLTLSHSFLLSNSHINGQMAMMVCILLGFFFTLLQGLEYLSSSFTMSDSIFGTTFFVMTGFHGLHVILGTTFLIVGVCRFFLSHLSYGHHSIFELSAWYWHFVDVVWIFLYFFIYSWAM